jgi:hypothetical protein
MSIFRKRHTECAYYIIILSLICLSGCGGRKEKPATVTVLISGDTAGWIVPCGCTTNQSGGLPRRGTLVERFRRQGDLLVLDAGGAVQGDSPYDRMKFEAILQGEKAMGLAAHNLGKAEVQFGPAYLREVARRLDVPFVSTNTIDTEGKSLAEPCRTAVVGAFRVAVLGVISPQYATRSVRVSPPRQALLEQLGMLRGKYDAAVVLAYLPEEELRALAESLPEADVVAGGPTGQPIQPQNRGPTLLVSATRQGKFAARLSRNPADGHWTGRIIELSESFADDPQQVENVKKFRTALAKRDVPAADTAFGKTLSGAMPPEYRIAGSESCRECHEEDYLLWKKSKHAQAWETLRAKDGQRDPECQRCHVQGYGLPGGFVSAGRSADRVNVGCEDCHGPSAAHCRKTEIPTGWADNAKQKCIVCHDDENSPKFDYDTYWEKIRHGQDATKKEK